MLNSFTLIKNRRYFATLSPGLPVVCNPLAVWGARDEVGHCLATGVRWSEADDLSSSGLLDDCAVFATTRNGRVRGGCKIGIIGLPTLAGVPCGQSVVLSLQ